MTKRLFHKRKEIFVFFIRIITVKAVPDFFGVEFFKSAK